MNAAEHEQKERELDELQQLVEELEAELAGLDTPTRRWGALTPVVCLLLVSLLLVAAVHVKGGDLEVHSVTTTAGSDSYLLKLWGESSAGQKGMILQNLAESGTDDYRLGILNAGSATEIVTVDDDGLVGIMDTTPGSPLDVTGDLNIASGGLKGCTIYGESEGVSTTNRTTYGTKAFISLPAGGTYVVIATAETFHTYSTLGCDVRLYNSTTRVALSGQMEGVNPWVSDYSNTFGCVKRVTVGGTAETVAIQWRAESSSGTANIMHARLFAIRID